ncbi:FkbM family methyltransferase [Brevifollis gellanilyticus]|uniref:Methyltransferase FkbM domain-containing protein n=1 Tax=Brevifollis gellanilyticus TaxID=748831 RepID=A0A512MB29_9BACT|nr:FkbM family methyltransferase [Brevifollis gellanilyticus]GEP43541.1 hypothetical protein BGE01nite_28320 [Brevifollis gellanilyticus]
MLFRLLGRRRLDAATVHGFRMLLDDTDLIQRTILYSHAWEPEVSEVLRREFTEEDVFYDVGANIGYDSFLALGVGVKLVVAFDPEPVNEAIYKANFALNGFSPDRLVFVSKAVGDRPGKMSFRRAPSANMGIGSLSAEEVDGGLQVEVVSLDHMIRKKLIPSPTVMKIDVEGWEKEALSGMAETLSSNPPRMILLEADCDEAGRMKSQDLADLLAGKGFHLQRIGPFDSKANYVARHSR